MPIISASQVANKTFDFVIVGGGTAGLTLATRLSEDASVSVLVLEAGGANIDDPAILRLASWGSHFGQAQYDWNHKTVPQPFANNVEYAWPRGKGLGGSAAINFMCWTRPPTEEIDDIEKLGNPGWNWANLDRSLKKLERYVKPTPEVVEKYDLRVEGWTHGTGGSLYHAFPGNIPPAETVWRDTMLNLGFDHAKASLGGDPAGFYFSTASIDPNNHTRSYPTTAFFLPVKERSNLSVVVDALVSRIATEVGADDIVDAKKVEFVSGGEAYAVKIGKEVVLSAGALKSPQILELSGIGRKDVLDGVGISTVLDLPGVGENMQEHCYVGVSFELKDDIDFDTIDILRDPENAKKHLELHGEGKGLFTTGVTGFVFAPLEKYSERADAIHREAIEVFEKTKDKYSPGVREQLQIQIERLKHNAPGCEIVSIPGFLSFPNPPKPGVKYWSFLSAQNHMFSRGTVHVVSKDPQVDPAYDPHYFEEKVDLDTFVECVKFMRKIKDSAPFSDLVVTETNPGPNCTTDEQIADWLKAYMSTTYHTSSTLSMMPKDKGGVVDPELKVYGTSNIRVCDLSILPLHFAAHPQATIYSFAERAAEILQGKKTE